MTGPSEFPTQANETRQGTSRVETDPPTDGPMVLTDLIPRQFISVSTPNGLVEARAGNHVMRPSDIEKMLEEGHGSVAGELNFANTRYAIYYALGAISEEDFYPDNSGRDLLSGSGASTAEMKYDALALDYLLRKGVTLFSCDRHEILSDEQYSHHLKTYNFGLAGAFALTSIGLANRDLTRREFGSLFAATALQLVMASTPLWARKLTTNTEASIDRAMEASIDVLYPYGSHDFAHILVRDITMTLNTRNSMEESGLTPEDKIFMYYGGSHLSIHEQQLHRTPRSLYNELAARHRSAILRIFENRDKIEHSGKNITDYIEQVMSHCTPSRRFKYNQATNHYTIEPMIESDITPGKSLSSGITEIIMGNALSEVEKIELLDAYGKIVTSYGRGIAKSIEIYKTDPPIPGQEIIERSEYRSVNDLPWKTTPDSKPPIDIRVPSGTLRFAINPVSGESRIYFQIKNDSLWLGPDFELYA